ncbi:F-box domain containing protein [Pandoravirus dulcis]|uniref:F-box domain containing protein n=1 Tax=Pandoravirus dulcis TaxID=1349409 RepID=S4VVN3_9VIRU|nr:F-box domain containing protein [Pandoravirus dulcis]AGO81999.1 F-box domain containing protein [Pandoravirus dulcis]
MEPTETRPHASKRRRTGDPEPQTDGNVWALLPEEAAMAVLSYCEPADLGRLSAVDWRLRRLAIDERLWKGIYETAFPPCGSRCIAALGASVAGLDIAALVNRGMDIMFDASKTTAGCALPLPEPVVRLGCPWGFRSPSEQCQHHWPDVIAARGYRWAYAVAIVSRPRFFGPHLDGSAPCLVGRSVWCGATHRGDLADTRFNALGAHGYGTANHGQFLPSSHTTDYTIKARAISGHWSHGVADGRAVAWCALMGGVHDTSRIEPRDQCVGFYQGDWCQGMPHGSGVLIAPDHDYPIRKCGGPSVVRCGPWRLGSAHVGNRAWGVVASEDRPNAGVGITGTDPSRLDIVRTADGRVAFLGDVRMWMPHSGQLMGRDGSVLYDGIVCTDKYDSESKGQAIFPDGRAAHLDMESYKLDGGVPIQRKTHGRAPITYKFYNGVMTAVKSDLGDPVISIAYPNGDRMNWYGGRRERATPVKFIYADGRALMPPLGWNMVSWCHPPRSSCSDAVGAEALLCDTPFASNDNYRNVLQIRAYLDHLVFWPRLAGPDDAAGCAAFLDHMAAHHGPSWVRCRAAVRLMLDLDGPTARE